MPHTHLSKFAVRERVHIDADQSIVARIAAVRFFGEAEPIYELSWIHNGTPQTTMIEEYRLTPVSEERC